MFLHRIFALLHSVGCSLATCVKLLSGAKCCARKAFALLFVLIFCLSTSVFAADYNHSPGFLYWSPDLDIVVNNSGNSYSVLNGYFPATFSSERSNNAFILSVLGSVLPKGSSNTWNATTASTFYVEVLYSVNAPLDVERVAANNLKARGVLFFGPADGSTSASSTFVYAADMAAIVDDSLIPMVSASTANNFVPEAGTFHVKRYWGYRMYFNPLNLTWSYDHDSAMKLQVLDTSKYIFSDPNYSEGIYDNVVVNTGVLAEINGAVKDIQISTSQIQSDVSSIKDTVTDTNNQLQNPNSNIWKAAGSAISDAVTGLFVPDQTQLDAKMKELENIVIAKMGDTYEVVQKTQVYEDQFVACFTGGGSDYAFHFPGISVPLPDGTVSILPEQDVHLQNKAFNVFRNLLGTIVAVLCGFSAVHLGHDFIICIFSGVSYWGFLRSRHDK